MENGVQCVHDNNRNLDDANLVCLQLGYDGAWTAYYQPGEGLVKVEEPQCTGQKTTLLDCWTAQSNGGSAFCSDNRDDAVDCITSSYGIAVVRSIALVRGTIIHTGTCLFVSMCACLKICSCIGSLTCGIKFNCASLYFTRSDHVNITFHVEVDGRQWAVT